LSAAVETVISPTAHLDNACCIRSLFPVRRTAGLRGAVIYFEVCGISSFGKHMRAISVLASTHYEAPQWFGRLRKSIDRGLSSQQGNYVFDLDSSWTWSVSQIIEEMQLDCSFCDSYPFTYSVPRDVACDEGVPLTLALNVTENNVTYINGSWTISRSQ
jgi:hypothetical protein